MGAVINHFATNIGGNANKSLPFLSFQLTSKYILKPIWQLQKCLAKS